MHVTHFVYAKGQITKIKAGDPWGWCKFEEQDSEKGVRVTTIKPDPAYPEEHAVAMQLLDATNAGSDAEEDSEHDDSLVQTQGAPAAAAYKSHSGDIIEVLDFLMAFLISVL